MPLLNMTKHDAVHCSAVNPKICCTCLYSLLDIMLLAKL
jgi:hypothetical protein